MVREHRLHPSDLILPVFVLAGENRTEAVASMPGVERMTLDRLFPVAEQCLTLGVPCLARASSSAAMQKPVSIVFDRRHARTARVAQSIIATRYRKPSAIGI